MVFLPSFPSAGIRKQLIDDPVLPGNQLIVLFLAVPAVVLALFSRKIAQYELVSGTSRKKSND